ncbi:MAG: aminotransferase class V-fold PLP-dependent enzyme [Phycisphaerales bacterium]|nr:aminotransferase class V-fold PLP-dependent enzyme [Phycisphaerales bacterium]
MTEAIPALADLLGADAQLPVYGGGIARYVNLDNAATTPPFRRVWDRLTEVMPMYGSVHRGDGYKSSLSTALFEGAKAEIMTFADGDHETDALLLGTNATACINYLAARIGPQIRGRVLVPASEHSSNLLPWLKYTSVCRCPVLGDGRIDLDALEARLRGEKIGLVACAGASNVTGIVADVRTVARLARRHGAQVALDASQLVAHRPISRGRPDDEDFIDYVIFAGHKMYAPFGAGVLLIPRERLQQGAPGQPGGGTVRLIVGEDILWEDAPQREQGGTSNFPGIIALAEASRALKEIGFDRIRDHERRLLDRLQRTFTIVEGVQCLRGWRTAEDSLPIVPFTVDGHPFAKVSAYLGLERGIGVRSGHLCQFELVASMLGLSASDVLGRRELLQSGDRRGMYGIVRASCGIGTSSGDIDALELALTDLMEHGTRAEYRRRVDGRFEAVGWPGIVQCIAAQTPA